MSWPDVSQHHTMASALCEPPFLLWPCLSVTATLLVTIVFGSDRPCVQPPVKNHQVLGLCSEERRLHWRLEEGHQGARIQRLLGPSLIGIRRRFLLDRQQSHRIVSHRISSHRISSRQHLGRDPCQTLVLPLGRP